MKKYLIALIAFSFLAGASCQQKTDSPIEGAWQLISARTVIQDTVIFAPASVNSNHMKIIGEKYFSTIWQDTTLNESNIWYAGFNGGTYTFKNEVYTESLEYFNILSSIGGTFSAKVEFTGDTMVLTYLPEDPNSKFSSVEKWKRLK